MMLLGCKQIIDSIAASMRSLASRVFDWCQLTVFVTQRDETLPLRHCGDDRIAVKAPFVK